jgi:3-isopropylmalate/(R)-2-methylmalate dehydratase small subunit
VPVVVSPEVGEQLLAAIKADPSLEITVDVERRTVAAPAIGLEVEFPLDNATQERFVEGLDDIGISLRHEADITAYEKTRPGWLPTA